MIDAELATFLQEGLSIHLATRDGALRPNGGRVTAVRVEDDGAHLTLYVPKVALARLLPDLEENGQAAVVFVRPTDDRACQVKGVFVAVRAARQEDRRFVTAQWERTLDNLERIGIPRAVTAGWTPWPVSAVRLRPTAIFNQTPGPAAGTQIA